MWPIRYPEMPSPDSNQAYYSDETLLATPHLLEPNRP
jgi:hypothetical protein